MRLIDIWLNLSSQFIYLWIEPRITIPDPFSDHFSDLIWTYCHLRDKEANDDDFLAFLENPEDETVTKDRSGEKHQKVTAAPTVIDSIANKVKYSFFSI